MIKRCKTCGCTDGRACPQGCFWVYEDLCSACVFKAIASAAGKFDEETRFDIGEQLVTLADRIHPENDSNAAAEEEFFEQLQDEPLGPRLWRPGDPL